MDDRYKYLKSRRICIRCGKNKAFGKLSMCLDCLDKATESSEKYRNKNRDKIRKSQMNTYYELKEKGICVCCRKRDVTYGKVRCGICSSRIRNKYKENNKTFDSMDYLNICHCCKKPMDNNVHKCCNRCYNNILKAQRKAVEKFKGEDFKMELNDYQKLAKRTINESLSAKEKILHSLHGMSGEVGELHSIYQKLYQGHTLDFEHIKKELGDLLWFISEFCTAYNWKLSDVAQMNIDKLKARYPDGFNENQSLNRKSGDI